MTTDTTVIVHSEPCRSVMDENKQATEDKNIIDIPIIHTQTSMNTSALASHTSALASHTSALAASQGESKKRKRNVSPSQPLPNVTVNTGSARRIANSTQKKNTSSSTVQTNAKNKDDASTPPAGNPVLRETDAKQSYPPLPSKSKQLVNASSKTRTNALPQNNRSIIPTPPLPNAHLHARDVTRSTSSSLPLAVVDGHLNNSVVSSGAIEKLNLVPKIPIAVARQDDCHDPHFSTGSTVEVPSSGILDHEPVLAYDEKVLTPQEIKSINAYAKPFAVKEWLTPEHLQNMNTKWNPVCSLYVLFYYIHNIVKWPLEDCTIVNRWSKNGAPFRSMLPYIFRKYHMYSKYEECDAILKMVIWCIVSMKINGCVHSIIFKGNTDSEKLNPLFSVKQRYRDDVYHISWPFRTDSTHLYIYHDRKKIIPIKIKSHFMKDLHLDKKQKLIFSKIPEWVYDFWKDIEVMKKPSSSRRSVKKVALQPQHGHQV